MCRILLALCLMFVFGGGPSVSPAVEPVATEAKIPESLTKYVQKEDTSYKWSLRKKLPTPQGTIYDVHLTSQTWQNITWVHTMYVFEPKVIEHQNHAILFVTGGRTGQEPRGDRIGIGFHLATLAKARVIMLWQVPNQPLLGDYYEDGLITETWLKYLATGDETWPLLFPMVKSAVRAMDAYTALGKQEWKQETKGFVVTGASKRGWTSWLSAVADSRVKGIAPMVIDTLNFPRQMEHQINTWGKYSEQIRDYTSKGLVKPLEEETPRDTQLRRMMDPYTYREKLTLPKLVINGTNDPYWVVDAIQNYWDDLKGPKYVLQIPNAGHGLNGGHLQLMQSIATFFQLIVTGSDLPKIQVQRSMRDNTLWLKIQADTLRHATLWQAKSAGKDFRKARWNALNYRDLKETVVVEIPLPESGHLAYFVTLHLDHQGTNWGLSIPVERYSAPTTE